MLPEKRTVFEKLRMKMDHIVLSPFNTQSSTGLKNCFPNYDGIVSYR